MIILYILIASIVSSILYRAGGMSKEQPYWIPVWMRHSWVRDWLCPMCFGIFFLPHTWFQFGMWLCFYGATGGMFSTYWDWMFGDVDNFWFSGFMVGLASLFLLWAIPWYWIVGRAVFLAVMWGGVNLLAHKYHWAHSDHIEEHTRGFTFG